jgi:hypothetical protein
MGARWMSASLTPRASCARREPTLHRLWDAHAQRFTLRVASAHVGQGREPCRSHGPTLDAPEPTHDRAPCRAVRLDLPGRWSRASCTSDARPDARPRRAVAGGRRAVRRSEHASALQVAQQRERGTPGERATRRTHGTASASRARRAGTDQGTVPRMMHRIGALVHRFYAVRYAVALYKRRSRGNRLACVYSQVLRYSHRTGGMMCE